MSAVTLKKQLDQAMLKIQDLLDQAGLDEYEPIQNAFNALACAVDETVNESY